MVHTCSTRVWYTSTRVWCMCFVRVHLVLPQENHATLYFSFTPPGFASSKNSWFCLKEKPANCLSHASFLVQRDVKVGSICVIWWSRKVLRDHNGKRKPSRETNELGTWICVCVQCVSFSYLFANDKFSLETCFFSWNFCIVLDQSLETVLILKNIGERKRWFETVWELVSS